MSVGTPSPLVVNGWNVYAHPLFLAQLVILLTDVESLKAKDPAGYTRKNATKRLQAIYELAFDRIPQDPTREEYRQGNTLGNDHKHWFRAKFFQQYRLFFRFDLASKVIVYAWVNDHDTKRAYGSVNDAYTIFGKMLKRGCPPDSWHDLLEEAKSEGDRLQQLATRSAI